MVVDCCYLFFGKHRSILPSEGQGSIGSRDSFGHASCGQCFLYGRESKWKQGMVLLVGLPKNSLQTFPAAFSG